MRKRLVSIATAILIDTINADNENRNSQDPRTQEYFQQLEDQYRQGGIAVPLTYNDPGMRSGFINGTGHVDIYGLVRTSGSPAESAHRKLT